MTARRKGPAAKRARSGPSLTDEQRAERGIGRITLRLPQLVLDLLSAESRRSGHSRAELVESMIRAQCGPRRGGE